MKTNLITIAALLACFASAAPKTERPQAAEAFSRLKTLVGEWEANTSMGKAHLSYELIGGGTALVERESMDGHPAMMTVYHLDGDRLLLTHYCMAGNQPRMQARSFNAETGEIDFQFLDITNLAGPKAGYMHNAKMRIVDANHLTSEWQFFENGGPKMVESAEYTRVR